MIDPSPITETPPPPVAPSDNGTEMRFQGLEQRVGHLEEQVASLQDRVTAAMTQAPLHSVRQAAGVLLEAGRQLLPGAVATVAPTPSAPVPATPTQAVPLTAPPVPPTPPSPPRRRWLLGEIYAELYAIVRMYLDPRF